MAIPTQKTYTNRRYLDALAERVLIFDGAMGTNLQRLGLTAEHFGGEKTNGCNDYLVISYPQAVEEVHRSFLEVGVDVIETCTFRANRMTLGEYGLGERVLVINLAAARLARRLADEYSTPEQPRFVAGSIGPSGKLLSINDPGLSDVTFSQMVDVFREQAIGLIEGGVDLILIETSQDILEVKTAWVGIHQAFDETGVHLPIQAQVTLDTTGRMLLGTDASAVLAVLDQAPVDVIGLNCSTGPDYMREPIRYLGEQAILPVSCIPNAGLPLNVDGQAVYPLEPEPFAETLAEYVEKYHVSVVGGCCGTTPAHLKRLVEKIHSRPQEPRPTQAVPLLASSVQAVPMQQEPKPFLIGERLNAQGSRQFKAFLMAEDMEGVLGIANQQMASGAHGLDVSVAVTERGDEAFLMQKVIKTMAPVVRAPLVIDSTEPEVIEVALQSAPGRCLINSTHLESGPAKAACIFRLAKTYNAAVIILTIDEAGMAKPASRKLEVARRIYAMAVGEFGLQPHDLVFDALTFTLATGDPEFSQSAVETLEGIRQIKAALPGVLTSLGVSNVSFGLSPATRAVLNSVFLYHAVLAGLDMAIVNPAQITPYAEIPTEARQLAEDLIFNQRPDALQRLIEHYAGVTARSSQVDPTEGMEARERLAWRILHRVKDGVEADIDELLSQGPIEERAKTAVSVLNTIMLPAMKEVGDKFGAGELILPFVLQSAEVMKKAVAYLEGFLERKEGVSKGTLVLATVYGDVHDIGKNLVKTILSNNGYRVVDLGKQVPAETIITKAVEEKADAIGLSALLVSTSKQMPLIVNELQRRGLSFPVLIGGAAINRRFGRRILLTEEGSFYAPGVYYCKDAFEGLSAMDTLSNPETAQAFKEQNRQEAEMELGRAQAQPKAPSVEVIRSEVPPAEVIPHAPTWGPRIVRQIPLDAIFDCLAKNELFRLSWGAKNTHGEAWETLREEFEDRLGRMHRQAVQENWVDPQGAYGYWPAQSDGNDLVIYDPGSLSSGSHQELTRMSFPRQPESDHICLADYFSSVQSGKMDVVAFQVVTMGAKATRHFDKLQGAGEYSDAYYFHGLAVQLAEAAAEYLHRHIRRELGLGLEQGKRYSWGYPAIPDLADHAKVFQLLPLESELGMTLTPAYQLVPEQSTAAIILHHPKAKYYSVGESRVEQLMG